MVESLQSTTSLLSRILGWLQQKNSEDRRAIVYFYLVDNIAQWMHLVYSAPSHDQKWANDQLEELKEEIVQKCLENKYLMSSLNELNKREESYEHNIVRGETSAYKKTHATKNPSISLIKTYPIPKRRSSHTTTELSKGRSYSTGTIKEDKNKGQQSLLSSGIKIDSWLAGKESPLGVYTHTNYLYDESFHGSSAQLTPTPQKSSIEISSTDRDSLPKSSPEKSPVISKASSRRKTRQSKTAPTTSRIPSLPGRIKSSRTPLPSTTKSSRTSSLSYPTKFSKTPSPSVSSQIKTSKTPSHPTKSRSPSQPGPIKSSKTPPLPHPARSFSLPGPIETSTTPLLTGQTKSCWTPSLQSPVESSTLPDPTKSSSIPSLPIPSKSSRTPLVPNRIKSARASSLSGPITSSTTSALPDPTKSFKTPSLQDPTKSFKTPLRIKSHRSNSLPGPIKFSRTPSMSGPAKSSTSRSLSIPTKSTRPASLPGSLKPTRAPSLPGPIVPSRTPSPADPRTPSPQVPIVPSRTPSPKGPIRSSSIRSSRSSSLSGHSIPKFIPHNKRHTVSAIPHSKYMPILKLANDSIGHLIRANRTDSGAKKKKHVTILVASRPDSGSKKMKSKKEWY